MKAFFCLLLVVVLISGIMLPSSLRADVGAYLYFSKVELATTTDPIIIEARVNPNELSINAVSLQINFDATILQIEAIETGSSFCIYFLENTFNNASGTLSIQCGLPSPGTSTDSIIAEIRFNKISEGYSRVNIKESSEVLLNDGLGTNVLNNRFEIVL